MHSLISTTFALFFTLSCASTQQTTSTPSQGDSKSSNGYSLIITDEAHSSVGVLDIQSRIEHILDPS